MKSLRRSSALEADGRALRDKMDTLGAQLNAKIDGLKDTLAATRVWALMLYIALAAAMLGTTLQSAVDPAGARLL